MQFCFWDSPQAIIDVGAQIFFYEANRRERQSFSLTSFSTNDAAFFRPIKRRSGIQTEKCSRFCFSENEFLNSETSNKEQFLMYL